MAIKVALAKVVMALAKVVMALAKVVMALAKVVMALALRHRFVPINNILNRSQCSKNPKLYS